LYRCFSAEKGFGFTDNIQMIVRRFFKENYIGGNALKVIIHLLKKKNSER